MMVSRNRKQNKYARNAIEGIVGEITNVGGRIVVSVPATGSPDCIPFHIGKVWPTTEQCPSWADVSVGKTRCRINPDLCQPPWFRLGDCLWLAHTRAKVLPFMGFDAHGYSEFAEITLPAPSHPNAQAFVLWRTKLCSHLGEVEVVMIDTKARVVVWGDQMQPHDIMDSADIRGKQ